MKENTNKTIAINTIFLYIRLFVVTICSLFITRFALQALGENDYGLFSVVGSIISFIAIINTIMVTTSYRFIAVAIGKGDTSEVNRIFNVCLVIHIAVAIFTALVAFPVGEWYIHRFVNYDGPVENALMVYRLSITGSIISFLAVPFAGLLTAKEKFIVFCSVEIIVNLLKVGATILMLYYYENRLLFYACTQAFLTAIPTLYYWQYCRLHYPDATKWSFVKDKKPYKKILGFSGWIGYGALSWVGKSQGAQLLVNGFFTTVMNAGLGVANTINHFITLFANNVTKPIAPQLTKSYVSGNLTRCNQLLIMSTKFSFLTILLISSPFFSDMDWVLSLWLGRVPEYASMFAKLLIIDALVGAFNSGISAVIAANGKLAFFQLTTNTLKLLSIGVAFIALKMGAPAFYVFYIYIAFSLISLVFVQISLHRVGGFSFRSLFKGSYLPSLIVCALYVPILFIKLDIRPLIHMALVFIYLCLLILFVGFKKEERTYLLKPIMKIKNKVSRASTL